MSDNEIIDLTESFTLANHGQMSNANIVIELDESLNDTNQSESPVVTAVQYEIRTTVSLSSGVTITDTQVSNKMRKVPASKKKDQAKTPRHSSSINKSSARDRSPLKFGDCPICFDELGKNFLASTKCGHVFCQRCLEQSMRTEKKCPTCRQSLKGNKSYHPLYLTKN